MIDLPPTDGRGNYAARVIINKRTLEVRVVHTVTYALNLKGVSAVVPDGDWYCQTMQKVKPWQLESWAELGMWSPEMHIDTQNPNPARPYWEKQRLQKVMPTGYPK